MYMYMYTHTNVQVLLVRIDINFCVHLLPFVFTWIIHAHVHAHHTFQSVSISTCMRLSATVTWNRWCQHWPPASLSTAGTNTTRPLWWWPVAMDDLTWLDSFWREGKDSSLVYWTPLYLHVGSPEQGRQNTICCPCYFEKSTKLSLK